MSIMVGSSFVSHIAIVICRGLPLPLLLLLLLLLLQLLLLGLLPLVPAALLLLLCCLLLCALAHRLLRLWALCACKVLSLKMRRRCPIRDNSCCAPLS